MRMRLLLAILAIVILSVLAVKDVQSENAGQEPTTSPKEDTVNEQPPKAHEHDVTTKSAAEGILTEQKTITFEEVEKFAKEGRHFMVAYVHKEGKMSRDYVKDLPQINDQLARFNKSLKIYPTETHKDDKFGAIARVIPSTILFLGDTNGFPYYGERTAPEILKFYQRVLNATVREIKNSREISAFKNSSYATVLFIFKDEKSQTVDVLMFARKFLDVKFGYFIDKWDMDSSLLHVYRNDDGMNSLDPGASESVIEDFIERETHLPLYHYPKDGRVVPSLPESAYIFYVHNSEKISSHTSEWLRKIGNKHRGTYALFVSKFDELKVDPLGDILDLKRDGFPYVRMFLRKVMVVSNMEDSIPGEVNEESVSAFLKATESGNVKQFMVFQNLNENWNTGSVITLAAAVYRKVVHNDTMNVFVMIYNNSSESDVIPVIEKIAEAYKGVGNISFAKIDVGRDSLPIRFQPVTNVPSLRMYEKFMLFEQYPSKL
ncbi:hypothetical protein GCK32_012741 [Trichostrongylus colubriformis]|uniref:Uncharacterized protein n=1 Tax=Trichostrongylus colubriformis TaxID=6319 RepID=A0AAN8ERP6_TRICO